jgi:sugar phosphate isomerase/epimerase
MFTAAGDLAHTLRDLTAIGFAHGQMAIPGTMSIEGVSQDWLRLLHNAGFTLHTLVGVYKGESYADIPAVRQTVGFIPVATREEREARSLAIIDLAAEMGIPGFGTHIGFVPEDTGSADYTAVLAMVRRIADHAAQRNITFALETGQETAQSLLEFLLAVDRPNVGVNFDPANMILYGTGDPIEALEIVGPHVITVHAKDGIWPPAGTPGSLGTEVPLGEGKVDFPAFLSILRKFGYEGPLFIEREAKDPQVRLRDMARGKAFLTALSAEV